MTSWWTERLQSNKIRLCENGFSINSFSCGSDLHCWTPCDSFTGRIGCKNFYLSYKLPHLMNLKSGEGLPQIITGSHDQIFYQSQKKNLWLLHIQQKLAHFHDASLFKWDSIICFNHTWLLKKCGSYILDKQVTPNTQKGKRIEWG